MAEINDIDLKLNIVASDEATSVLETLNETLDALKETLSGFDDLDPFAKLQEDAQDFSAVMDGIKGKFDELKGVFDDLGGNGLTLISQQMNELSQQGQNLRNTMGEVQSEIESMSREGENNPLTAWNQAANELRATIDEVLQETTDVGDEATTDPFSEWSEAILGIKGALQEVIQQLTQISDISKTIKLPTAGGVIAGSSKASGISEEEMTAWMASIDQGSLTPEQMSDYSRAVVNQEPEAFYQKWGRELGAPQLPPADEPESPSLMDGIFSGLHGANTTLNEIPGKMLGMGMNALMGYYGLQAISSGGNQFSSIQQLMQENNQTVNEAAQSSVMLGSAGLSGTAGVEFLSDFAKNMQTVFEPEPGSGKQSKDALILDSLGISQKDLTESPWELLNTVGSRYRSLITSGQGSQAEQLLGLTGTTQLQPLLANWGTYEKGASNVDLNMTPKQLNNAVQQNATLQESLQELALDFGQLAIALTPIVKTIAKALGDLAEGLSSGKGIGPTLLEVAKDLGVLGSVIVGAIAVIKASALLSGVAQGAGLAEEVSGGGLLVGLGKLLGKTGKGTVGLGKRLLGGGGGAEGEDLADAGAEEAGGLFTALGETISGLVSALGPAIAAVAAAAAPFLGIAAVMAAVIIVVVELVTHWKAVISVLDEVGKTLSDWTKDLERWASNLWSSVVKYFDDWTSDLVRWASGLWTAVSNSFESWTSDLVRWADGLWTAVSGAFTSWSSDLAKWAGGLWSTVAGSFIAWSSDLAKWASGLWNDVASSFTTWAANLGKWAGALWSDAVKGFDNWDTSIAAWAGRQWSNVVGAFSTWAQNLMTWAASLWSDVASDFEKWGTDLKDWASGLWASAKSGFDSFTSSLANWAENLWKQVESLWGGGGSSSPASSSVLSTLSSSTGSFVQTVYPYAQQVAEATGLPVQGIISQWAYESDYGQSEAAQENANLGGIIPFGKYGAGKDSSYAGFSNLAQFAQADITTLNESIYSGARQAASSGASIQDIYTLLSQEGYDTSNPMHYGSSVGQIAQSLATIIPHMAGGGVVDGATLLVAGEAGPEAIVPLSGSRGGSGSPVSNNTYNITITVPTTARDVKTMAQAVATEFINSLKRRGNYDFGG